MCQPFIACMAEPGNLQALCEDALELAARGLRVENGGRRWARVTLDVDSLPIKGEPSCAIDGVDGPRLAASRCARMGL